MLQRDRYAFLFQCTLFFAKKKGKVEEEQEVASFTAVSMCHVFEVEALMHFLYFH